MSFWLGNITFMCMILVTAVYDVTVAFQTPKSPELSNMLVGERCQAESFIRRIPISEIPHDDEKKSAEFIHKLFQEKVKSLICQMLLIDECFKG